MPRALLAFDKFKEALTAREACQAAARALRRGHPDWRLDLCPVADGGDGFAEVLTRAADGEWREIRVSGPRGGLVPAAAGFVAWNRVPEPVARRLRSRGPGGRLAIADMASASGLALLPAELRDPRQCSTFGTGQLIRAAAEAGASAVLLGVGGSATHDLGAGALSALGFDFRDAEGGRLRPPVPARWPQIAAIEGEAFEGIPPVHVACDVRNPLLGREGALAAFGPQKGLRAEDGEALEAETARIASLLVERCGAGPGDPRDLPGAGAAGGLGFGLHLGLGAPLLPGFELAAEWLSLAERIAAADAVLTGEGAFDASSAAGKAAGSVARMAVAAGKRVHVFAGRVEPPAAVDPLLSLHAITPEHAPREEALRDAGRNLAAAVERAI